MGRPPKYTSVEELEALIEKYFTEIPEEEWTVTGLALALDTTRDVLIDYQNKDDFSYTIKNAKERVHNAYEKDLRRKGRSGDIFALKNFGWKDKQETDVTSGGEKISVNLIGYANSNSSSQLQSEEVPTTAPDSTG